MSNPTLDHHDRPHGDFELATAVFDNSAAAAAAAALLRAKKMQKQLCGAQITLATHCGSVQKSVFMIPQALEKCAMHHAGELTYQPARQQPPGHTCRSACQHDEFRFNALASGT